MFAFLIFRLSRIKNCVCITLLHGRLMPGRTHTTRGRFLPQGTKVILVNYYKVVLIFMLELATHIICETHYIHLRIISVAKFIRSLPS